MKRIPEGKDNIESLVERLTCLSIRGLENMYNNEKMLFYYRLIKNGQCIDKEELSLRYTIISLLGLQKLYEYREVTKINLHSILTSLVEEARKIDNIGDIGLLTWLCALASSQMLEKFFSNIDINNALNRYPDARQGLSTELAWFLTGLSYSAMVDKKYSNVLKDLAEKTYRILLGNYRGRGIFGHQSTGSISGMIRGRFGSFADQVYPIYALATYAQAYGKDEALKVSLETARTICCHQGNLGQWWWHYDASTGKVLGRYPVYSVHQDGMAPMALYAIGERTGIDFSENITKGLAWITGKNELAIDMIDTTNNLIWRSIFRHKYKLYIDEALSLCIGSGNHKEYSDLMVRYECRSYHLGWILYAFATSSQNSRKLDQPPFLTN